MVRSRLLSATFVGAFATVFLVALPTTGGRGQSRRHRPTIDSGQPITGASDIPKPTTGLSDCFSRQFSLSLEWEWDWQNAVAPNSNQVMSAPAVADLNQDGIPDVVFPTAIPPYGQPWVLRAISGDDGSPLFDVISSYVGVHGSPAIGDIDNDGLPEIVIPGQTSGRIVAFENTGDLKWVSEHVFNQWGPTVCIANLDNQDLPEIIYGSTVLNASDGSIRWQGNYGRGYNSCQGPISCVVDLDLQTPPEVVAGNTAYRSDGQVYWQKAEPAGPNFVPPQLSDGFASVANFDSDPYPEIVLVTRGDVYLLEHSGEVKWSYLSFPGGGLVGAPTIEDFDGDGEPEIGLAGRNQYAVFETNGSLKWTQTIRDYSSGTCCSSVFDFDGDGTKEVAYADEVRLWIFRASNGEVLASAENSSCTTAEFPVVVDVDGDGQVEIVVCANNYGGWGVNKGIRVFGSAQNDWVVARKIWNQHTYHITNVNDDATIPVVEPNNWEIYNNFRCQAPMVEQLASISGGKFYDSNANGEWDAEEVGIADWLILLESGGEASGYSVVGTVLEIDERADIAPSVLTSSSSSGGAFVLLSVDSTYTDSSGHYSFLDLEPGTYTVREIVPTPPPIWIPTTPTEYSVTLQAGQNLTGVDFGNVTLGEIGARTIGYWKNHLERITSEMYAVLDTLPAFTGCGNPDSVLAILTPPWPDMAAKLRAQLLAMTLNVLSGIVSGDAIVYLGDDVLAAELLFGEPPPSFKSAQEVLDAVEASYDWSGWSHSEQEVVKDLLDRMNNDLLFILLGPPERGGSPPGMEGRACLGGQHEAVLGSYYLLQNVPNPFGAGGTAISFQVERSTAHVSLRVYDLSGRLVRTLVYGERRPGVHSVEWDGKGHDGRRVPNGVYLCQMNIGTEVIMRKMTLLR